MHRDEGARIWVEKLMRLRYADELVAKIVSRSPHGRYLQIFCERIVHFSITREYFSFDLREVKK